MIQPQHQALVLALLLLAPVAVLAWSGLTKSRAVRGRHALEDSRRPPTRALVGFAIVTFLVFCGLAALVIGSSLGAEQRLAALLLLTVGMAMMLAAPIHPIAGPLAYTVLSYTFPREHGVTETIMAVGTMFPVTALSLAGLLIWSWFRTDARINGSLLVWAVALFAGALSCAIVASVIAGRPPELYLLSRSARYLQAVTLFFVVAHTPLRRRDIETVALVMCALLAIRHQWLTGQSYREQNLAILSVVTVPLGLALAGTRPFRLVQAPLLLLAARLTWMLIVIQNRGAVVALVPAFVGVWLSTRRRLWWAGGAVVAGLALVPVAIRAGLFSRFNDIYQNGQFVGTALERVELWRGGWQIAHDHPMFGIGPGNFTLFHRLSPHNGFVEVATEVGFLGLLLYSMMFIIAGWKLIRLSAAVPIDWRRNVAGGLIGSFGAHLAAGSFLSSASLVWTYVLLGVAASVTRPPVSAETPSAEPTV